MIAAQDKTHIVVQEAERWIFLTCLKCRGLVDNAKAAYVTDETKWRADDARCKIEVDDVEEETA